MKKRFFLAYISSALAASALHFAYGLCPTPLVGLVSPVRESVWEHLKLLYVPFLISAFFLKRGFRDGARFWGGMLAALLWMPAALLGAYYTLAAGFGVTALWLDLALFYLILAGGYAMGCRLVKNGLMARYAGILVIAAGLYGAALVLLTLAPPALPIFLAA